MRIVHVKRKSVTNAETIMPAQNVRDLLLVKRRDSVSCLADE